MHRELFCTYAWLQRLSRRCWGLLPCQSSKQKWMSKTLLLSSPRKTKPLWFLHWKTVCCHWYHCKRWWSPLCNPLRWISERELVSEAVFRTMCPMWSQNPNACRVQACRKLQQIAGIFVQFLFPEIFILQRTPTFYILCPQWQSLFAIAKNRGDISETVTEWWCLLQQYSTLRAQWHMFVSVAHFRWISSSAHSTTASRCTARRWRRPWRPETTPWTGTPWRAGCGTGPMSVSVHWKK